jgi:hypothetical protein
MDKVNDLSVTTATLNFEANSQIKNITYYNREITNTELFQVVSYNPNN